MLGGASRRRLGRAAAAAAALLALAGVASPAAATTTAGQVTGRIDGFEPQGTGQLTIGFSALGIAAGQSIDLNSVKVTMGGTEVTATAKPAGEAASLPKRTSVLTIDVSGSMNEAGRLDNAKTAAKSYVAGLPADVLVGLVTFGSTVTVAQEPTTNRADINAAIDAITAGGSTALYNGIVAANELLGTDGFRSQLLLSDGENNGSGTEAEALASIQASGATFDAVALNPATVGTLTTLATAGSGIVVEVGDSQQLNDVFAAAAQAQASAIAITADVPADLAGTSVTVAVNATAGGTPISDQAAYALPGAGAVPTESANVGPVPVAPSDPGIFGNSWILPVGLAILGVGLFVLLAIAFVSTDRDSMQSGRLRRRLSRYSLTPRQEQTASSGALGESGVARSAVELAGRVTSRGDIDSALTTKLEAAGVPLKPAEWLLLHVGAAVGLALLFTLLSGFNLVATFLGLVIGLLVPYAYLAIKDERRKARFAAQLPDTLQLLSGSLAAGYSLPQAIDTVVRESDGPMAAELNRAIVEARLGVPIEDALDTVARRMNSVDFAWVVMAVRIQREVGGNLAEVLANVAATMRERERLRRQVEVLSAEGRLSAVILVLLPLLFIVYLVIARPEYLGVLYTTPLGILMIIVGIMLLIGGSFWLRKVVKVEV
ncbi:MAG: type II secretion system F family protein [Candidatus Nanopelagicales bacterium]